MEQATVFISYRRCERDVKILDRLKTFFAPLEQEGLICGWTDRDIEGGQRWRDQIDAALERAKIGVLLISQDFLTSDFIRKTELPRLFAREARDEITILPVFVSPFDKQYKVVLPDGQRVHLSELQGFAHPDRTLAHMDIESVEQEEIFLKLVERIRELIGKPPKPPAGPTLLTLTLRLDCVDDMLSVEALYPRPTRPHRTRLEDLHRALDNQDHEALFRALFESPFQLRELVSVTDGLSGTDEPTAMPLRLRLHCTDLESAALPWHCLAYNGRRLGEGERETGWIIEVISDSEAAGDVLTIALNNPLVVAPAAPTLKISARSHATNVTAHIRRLLADHALVPWASSYRELDVALDQEPDLLYVFAQISDSDGLGLALGKDTGQREFYPLKQLIERLAGFRSKPLVWLHLLPGDQAGPLLTQLWQQLCPHTRLLLIQFTTLGRQTTSLNATLDWMGAMAEGKVEPAAVLSRLGSQRDTYLWLGDRGIGLSPRNDLIGYIRASLIRLLLGRRSEKRQLAGGIREKPEGYLTLYGVCGDGQACVHDFPEQTRHYLEEFDPHTVVELRPLPLTMRLSSMPHDEVANQLMRDLNIGPLMSAREALERIPVVSPDREDTLIIALSWLLEPAADFTPEHLADWLMAWKQGVLDVFEKEQIPPEFCLLVGACIQWPEAWPEHDGSDAMVLQETIDRVLGRDNPRDYVYCIEMRDPLSLLRRTDLDEFYHDPKLRQRLRVQDLQIDRLADYILDKTKGRFQATVDLIYSECKHDYADFRDFLRDSSP